MCIIKNFICLSIISTMASMGHQCRIWVRSPYEKNCKSLYHITNVLYGSSMSYMGTFPIWKHCKSFDWNMLTLHKFRLFLQNRLFNIFFAIITLWIPEELPSGIKKIYNQRIRLFPFLVYSFDICILFGVLHLL